MRDGQVSARQSATLLSISCKSVQPVPVRVEEPVSKVRQSSSGNKKGLWRVGLFFLFPSPFPLLLLMH